MENKKSTKQPNNVDNDTLKHREELIEGVKRGHFDEFDIISSFDYRDVADHHRGFDCNDSKNQQPFEGH